MPTISSYRDSGLTVFALLLGFRIVNALLLRTFFQPDEYFQSLEPAWGLAFGQTSNARITWVRILPRIQSISPGLTIVAGVESPIAVVTASSAICGCLSGGGKTGCCLRLEPAVTG
jgi:hypothetical protein